MYFSTTCNFPPKIYVCACACACACINTKMEDICGWQVKAFQANYLFGQRSNTSQWEIHAQCACQTGLSLLAKLSLSVGDR